MEVESTGFSPLTEAQVGIAKEDDFNGMKPGPTQFTENQGKSLLDDTGTERKQRLKYALLTNAGMALAALVLGAVALGTMAYQKDVDNLSTSLNKEIKSLKTQLSYLNNCRGNTTETFGVPILRHGNSHYQVCWYAWDGWQP